MKPLLRSLLLVLLLVTTPLRGYAAAAMLGCGGHGKAAPVAMKIASHDHAATHEHRQAHERAHSHPHGGGHASLSHEAGPSHDHAHPVPAPQAHDADGGSCSACGDCCTGAGLPSAFALGVAEPVNATPIPFRARSFQGVVLELFDPPPLARD